MLITRLNGAGAPGFVKPSVKTKGKLEDFRLNIWLLNFDAN